jgi:hypothetical protein
MTAIPRPRTPLALLAPALLLGLLGPAGGMGPTDAAAAARLAATAPATDGQAILGDRVAGPRAAADRRDRRDQRDRPGTAPAALAGAAAGAEPPAAGAVPPAAGGRGRAGRGTAASPRGPPPLPAS